MTADEAVAASKAKVAAPTLEDASNSSLALSPSSVMAAAAELEGQAVDLLLNKPGIGRARGQTRGVGHLHPAALPHHNAEFRPAVLSA
jgi:hypothetical protein